MANDTTENPVYKTVQIVPGLWKVDQPIQRADPDGFFKFTDAYASYGLEAASSDSSFKTSSI
jgi:hypothetical protein